MCKHVSSMSNLPSTILLTPLSPDNAAYGAARGTVFHSKARVADIPSDPYEVDDLYSTTDDLKV